MDYSLKLKQLWKPCDHHCRFQLLIGQWSCYSKKEKHSISKGLTVVADIDPTKYCVDLLGIVHPVKLMLIQHNLFIKRKSYMVVEVMWFVLLQKHGEHDIIDETMHSTSLHCL